MEFIRSDRPYREAEAAWAEPTSVTREDYAVGAVQALTPGF